MTPTEPIQHHQPRGVFSTWLGVVLLFAFFGLLALVVLQASPRGTNYESKRAEARAKKLEDAQKENLTALTTYGWVDKAKGTARIPVEHAMQIMLVELPAKKPAAAGPIAAASPSAAPATSPGPSASPAAATSATPAPDGAKPTPGAGGNEPEHQPAAAANPPSAPPNTQPGPNSTPAASAPPAPAKAPVNASPTAAPAPPGTPLPVRGKTP